MRGWARQPQYRARIDRANPLSRGLVDAINFSSPHSIVNQTRPTMAGTQPIFSAGQNGFGLNNTAANGNEALSYGDAWAKPSAPFSAGYVFFQGNTTANTRQFFNCTNGTTSGYRFQSASSKWEAAVGSGSAMVTMASTNNATTGHHVAVIVYDGATLSLYVDGVLQGTPAAVTSMLAPVGSLQFGGFSINVHSEFFVLWNRPLNASEAAEFSANPYGLLRQPPRRHVASASTPTSIAAALGTAIAAGSTANVTEKTTIAAALGAATGLGRAASIARHTNVAGAVGAVVGAGRSAAVSMHVAVSAAAGHAAAAGLVATITRNTHVAAQAGAAAGQGLQALVALHTNVSAGTGTAVGEGLAASIEVRGSIACNVAVATATGAAATVSATLKIEAQTGAATAAGAAANVALRTGIAGHVANATADGLQAGITLTTRVQAGAGAAIGIGVAASVAARLSVAGSVGAALANGRQATVSSGSGGANASQVWAYALSDDASAGDMLQAIYAAVARPIEGAFTMADLLRIMAAIAAGKSSITTLGAGAARVEFRAVDDSAVRVVGEMAGSERAGVTLTP